MKRTVLFIVLGVAFAAVSLWYLLSAGRSKRATRLKYSLGGALLSLLAITSTGCGTIMPGCYDVHIPEPEREYQDPVYNINLLNEGEDQQTITVSNGRQFTFEFDTNTACFPKFVVTNSDVRVIQESIGEGEDNQRVFTLDVGDYVGEAKLSVWWMIDGYHASLHSTHICNLDIVADQEN